MYLMYACLTINLNVYVKENVCDIEVNFKCNNSNINFK